MTISMNFVNTDGLMKTCNKANNTEEQVWCTFFEKSTHKRSCACLRFDEFCTSSMIEPVIEEIELDLGIID